MIKLEGKELVMKLQEDLKVDMILLLETVSREKGELCSDILTLFLYNFKISEICRRLKISRFKVKRQLRIGSKFLKKTYTRRDFEE